MNNKRPNPPQQPEPPAHQIKAKWRSVALHKSPLLDNFVALKDVTQENLTLTHRAIDQGFLDSLANFLMNLRNNPQLKESCDAFLHHLFASIEVVPIGPKIVTPNS